MRILHTADLHLRRAAGERWSALEAVVAEANATGADALTISGDLFDRDVDAHELRGELRAVFEGFDGTVVITPGNHDAGGIREGDFFGENVRVIASIGDPVDIGDVRVVGIPFAAGDVEATLERLHRAGREIRHGAVNVLLYHGELLHIAPGVGAFGEEDGRDYMPAQLASFAPLGFDYILAGHFHSTFRVLEVGGGYFVYPGSPVSITRRETGRRCACLVETGTRPEAIALDTPYFESVNIHAEPEGSAELLAEIEAKLRELPPQARALLCVTGFVDLREMTLTEELFAEALARVAGENDATIVDSRWRNVADVLDGELFGKFETKLATTDLDERERRAVRELLLVALMEVEYAR